MARKKSAAKKAREAAALKENAASKNEVVVKDKPQDNSVNPERKELITSASSTKAKARPQLEPVSSESEVSSEDEEDEYGDLITEEVEMGINQVLETIKTNPSKLLDPSLKFFKDPETDLTIVKKSGEKPMYLKDYHRQTLLDGSFRDFDESETVDGAKSFATEQKEEKDRLLNDIKNAFNTGDEEEDNDADGDGFLKKKEKNHGAHAAADNIASTRRELPDPEKDQQGFLSAFLDNKAWIPQKGDKVVNLDKIDQDDEEDFDNAAEDFETAYNFRYEDPNSTEIISYARNQATLRRSKTNSRKRARDKEHEDRRREEEKKEELLKKKKNSKLNKVIDRLAKIKEAVGDEVPDDVIQKVFGDSLLNDDFDDADWDSKMAQIFDEQYYDAEVEKPSWDDEIMDGYDQEDGGANEEFEDEEVEGEVEGGEEDVAEVDDEPVGYVEELEDEGEPRRKKSKKEQLKDKKVAKKQKEALREKAQEIIEANTLKLRDEIDEEEDARGRAQNRNNEEMKFKYREVSPETFGLTTRDILLADDKQLNNLIGIKKFAPYRPRDLRMKDKRKYTKKKHLQDWRKETFRGMKMPDDAKDDEIWIRDESGSSSKQKTKKKSKRS
ncbi:uncharacterized protein LODBEIA_P23780 [Lodderomyces beijingensis]|uniref:Kri1-like C-terminal domain-containing protein n=1 Tax=Lodderomyces beijingensis TaxID=1775926 RepID=A0ABP0ZJ37_9ASCO